MNQVMFDTLKLLRERLEKDKRCLGIYLCGSYARRTADEYSDLDLMIITEKPGYSEFRKELRKVCDEVFGNILVWLPEGETPEYVNYAFLFEHGKGLFLYDVSVAPEDRFSGFPPRSADHILFDRAGLLARSVSEHKPEELTAPSLEQTIKCYWVYMYLNGKYLMRSDIYKLLYVQQVIFQQHMDVLRFFYPGKEWNWWANNIKNLPEAKREEMLVYFGALKIGGVISAIRAEMNMFSADARQACAGMKIEYPAALEAGVREHLEKCIKLLFS